MCKPIVGLSGRRLRRHLPESGQIEWLVPVDVFERLLANLFFQASSAVQTDGRPFRGPIVQGECQGSRACAGMPPKRTFRYRTSSAALVHCAGVRITLSRRGYILSDCITIRSRPAVAPASLARSLCVRPGAPAASPALSDYFFSPPETAPYRK